LSKGSFLPTQYNGIAEPSEPLGPQSVVVEMQTSVLSNGAVMNL
jgi:hypothetical protein